ncbi:MAG: glycoside hydrolase family 9 protein, partial [Bacteroidota bacterium]
MSKFTICFLTTQLLFHALSAQTTSPFIHVDQFGYLTNSNKVAVLSDPIAGFNSAQTYTAPATIELRDASTTALIQSFVPSQWNGGATHAGSGDRGWWVDFSAINTPGQYYLYDAVNNERSANFEINDTVYHNVLKEAGRMFYYNRCNMAKAAPYAEANWTDTNNFLNALQDANCRYVNDPGNAGLEKDLRGGWFDAGDYNKYVTFAFGAVHDLLAAYEQFPNAFSDSWNIPESGNGIPDVLDELKWELDWLLRMANPDGSVIIKMGSIDYADNAAAPPSANTDPRYYG